MGQGLHTKIQQIASAEFGVDLNQVKVNATNTSKVPNTSATAASSATDLNGMAVKNAIDKIKKRISRTLIDHFSVKYSATDHENSHLLFKNNKIFHAKNRDIQISFRDAIALVYLNQVSLSATGFYRTPDIGWDRNRGKGKPFHYYSFGMAVSEVLLDVLTGQIELLRTDILHDVGDSVNPNIDIGQIEGGFIQGVGWCTSEEHRRRWPS